MNIRWEQVLRTKGKVVTRRKIVNSDLIWAMLALTYVSCLYTLKSSTTDTDDLIKGMVFSIVCFYVIRCFLQKKTISLGIFDLRYTQHDNWRLFWLVVSIIFLFGYIAK